MRELIYVSVAKLQQLVPDSRKRWTGLRDFEAEITTPVGGLRIGRTALHEARPDLESAVARLAASSRAPAWFAEPGVRSGDWVHFEAPMSYSERGNLVTFVDVDEPSQEYPTGGTLRVLLHGSGHHLVGTPPSDGLEKEFTYSGWSRFVHLIRELESADNNSVAGYAGLPEILSRYIAGLTESLHVRYSSAWVAGYARITAIVPVAGGTILAATPLYVEHTTVPELG